MRRRGRPASPAAWPGLVLADGGLWARGLCRRIVRLGWHPLLRRHQGAKFRPAGQAWWSWRRVVVGAVKQRWCGRGTACVAPERRVECPLVAWWGEGDTAPWGRLTALAPAGYAAAW